MGGFIIGGLIGLTGVGGASLLTPFLLFLGANPVVAIGTDFLFNTVTKFLGFMTHLRQKTIEFGIVKELAWGSIPGIFLGIIILHLLNTLEIGSSQLLIKHLIGYVLILTSLLTILQLTLPSKYLKEKLVSLRKLTPLFGFIIGTFVGMTSVGSGSIFGLFLLSVYRVAPSKVAGTDIAHALILVAISSLIMVGTNSVNYSILILLLIGSIPGVFIGSKLATKLPVLPFKLIIIFIIATSGIYLIK
ncbi:sulfite exporter TauE/SafE family protein [Scopulibacillus darangshiensis]|uniref:sulfite exporter TauE/SafE family protein n=1 Tax=Scopulibacillus darangshiensis TaxID=442528 RepID=UPI0014045CA9|nr:sulfite exporter TauE/SafE family protein [Scopulibacillus darangshiensis]